MAIPGAMAEPFTLVDANSIELAIAPGQTMRWHRIGADVAEAPLAGGTADASGSGEEAPTSLAQDMAGFSFGMARSMLPAGRPTRFDVIDQSLEEMLNDGWRIGSATVTMGFAAFILDNDEQHALCLVANDPTAETGAAISDCRRLN